MAASVVIVSNLSLILGVSLVVVVVVKISFSVANIDNSFREGFNKKSVRVKLRANLKA